MYKEVVIGQKTVPMLANALTPKRAYEFFHEDFLGYLGQELQQGQILDLAEKLGFIMNQRAVDADMSKLQESDFDTWLEGFELGDLMEASADIVGLFVSTTKGSVAPK